MSVIVGSVANRRAVLGHYDVGQVGISRSASR